MTSPRLTTLEQKDAFSSPWSVRARVRMGLWNIAYVIGFRPSPKILGHWRLFLLRLFGATIEGTPYVASSARVRMPWNLVMRPQSSLGEYVECYNLTTVEVKARATVAQHAYLCAGTHDITTTRLPLVVGPITIGEDVFIGARAFILPGVVVGDGAVIGACAVVTRDVEPWTIVAGNPAKMIKRRVLADTTGA
jgi:putative colanic acid biosynthesis acetyltransferase WcaF